MDFAEFSDIEITGFTTYRQKLQEQFNEDAKNEIVKAYDENQNSLSHRTGRMAKMIPFIGMGTIMIDSSIEIDRVNNNLIPDRVGRNIYQRITAKFDEALEQVTKKVEESMNSLSVVAQEKFTAYYKIIAEKDQKIEELLRRIELLEVAPSNENRMIAEILENNPQIQNIINIDSYTVDTSLALSFDQKVITRLLLEIGKLNNLLKMANSKNLSLKNRLGLLFKNYYDEVIINTEVDKAKQEVKKVHREKEVLEGLSFDAQLKIDTLTAQVEQLKDYIAQNENATKPENTISDLVDCAKFFSNFGVNFKSLLLIAGLIIAIVNFTNGITSRTLMRKIYSVVLVPVIYSLIYLLIKEYNRI